MTNKECFKEHLESDQPSIEAKFTSLELAKLLKIEIQSI